MLRHAQRLLAGSSRSFPSESLSGALPWMNQFTRTAVNTSDFELLNSDAASVSPRVLIEGCGKGYFKCVGGQLKAPRQRIKGPMLIFESACFELKQGGKSIAELTPESLKILRLLRPSPDLILIGTGDEYASLPGPCLDYLASQGVNSEVQDTEHASGAWNVLTQEERKIVGLFYPLDKKILEEEEEDSEGQD